MTIIVYFLEQGLLRILSSIGDTYFRFNRLLRKQFDWYGNCGNIQWLAKYTFPYFLLHSV